MNGTSTYLLVTIYLHNAYQTTKASPASMDDGEAQSDRSSSATRLQKGLNDQRSHQGTIGPWANGDYSTLIIHYENYLEKARKKACFLVFGR